MILAHLELVTITVLKLGLNPSRLIDISRNVYINGHVTTHIHVRERRRVIQQVIKILAATVKRC